MAGLRLAGAVVVAAVVIGTIATVDSQEGNGRTATTKPATAKPYVAPRTPWGDPDIQGGWTNVNENGIPMERPDALAGKSLDDVDDSELAELVEVAQRARPRAPRRHRRPRDRRRPDALVRALRREEQPRVDGERSARRPHSAADGRRRRSARPAVGGGGRRRRRRRRRRADSWLDRSLYDRCITRGFPGSMMPAIYGNAYDITQAPGVVAIRYEMIHETRIDPARQQPAHAASSSHMGDARGRWEGDTLVVETTNFDPRTRLPATARRS